MAQLTDLEKVRRQRSKQRMIRNLFTLAVFAAFVFLAVSMIRKAGDIDLKTAYSDIKAEIVTGGGYPIPLPGGKISRFEAANDTLALLSDTNIYTYNHSGKQMMNIQHGMVNQTMVTSRDRLLLYDRGGTKLTLLSKSAVIHPLTTDYMLYTADIAQNGNFAVATGSGQYLAQVTVYNKNANEIFKWYSAEKPVISVSLSDTKDSMAVGCVDVSQGSYHSSISRFQFSIDKEIARAELPGELLLEVDYHNTNQIRAFTNQRMIVFNGELKETASYSYKDEKLDRFINSEKAPTILVLGNYAEGKQLTVVTLDNGLKELGRFSVGYDIVSIKSDASYVYIGAKNQVEIFKHDGTSVATVPAYNLQNMEVVGDRLYYTTNAAIDVIDVKAVIAPPEESKGTSGLRKDKSSSADDAASSSAATSEEVERSDSDEMPESAGESAFEEIQESSDESADNPLDDLPASDDPLNYDALEPKE